MGIDSLGEMEMEAGPAAAAGREAGAATAGGGSEGGSYPEDSLHVLCY
jgi:hypothetical protein